MWILDPKTGEKSATLTIFVAGFVVCLLKLLTSGLDLGTIKLSVFSGSDFALAVGALGTIYAARKHSDNTSIKNKETE